MPKKSVKKKVKSKYDLVNEILRSARGGIFTVTFIKRTTGEERVINAKLGVKKYLKGGVQPYKPKDVNCITVFDMVKKDYRNISVESVSKIKLGKQTFNF